MINLTANCLMHLKMNDDAANSNVYDEISTSNFTWEDNDGPENTENNTTTGKIGKALLNPNDPDRARVDCGDIHDFEYDDSFTLVAWIKYVASAGANRAIISKMGPSPEFKGYILYVDSSNRLSMIVRADGEVVDQAWARDNAPSGIVDLNWHLVAASYDGSLEWTGIKLYVDGVEVTEVQANLGSLTGFTTVVNSYNLYTGYTDLSASLNFQGAIDNALIFDRVLTAKEHAFLWNGGNGTEELRNSARSLTEGSLVGNSLAGKGLV